jgi:HNH endonuclease
VNAAITSNEIQTPNALELKRRRLVSAAVRRAVFERDHGSCTFIAGDGRRCGAHRFLELDHVRPWALDGESTVDNLRLRCRALNQHAARVCFGVAHMRAAVDRARRKRRGRWSDGDRHHIQPRAPDESRFTTAPRHAAGSSASKPKRDAEGWDALRHGL